MANTANGNLADFPKLEDTPMDDRLTGVGESRLHSDAMKTENPRSRLRIG
jgi:hypothetical protein